MTLRSIELTVRKAALRVSAEERALTHATRSVNICSAQQQKKEQVFQNELFKLRSTQCSALPVRSRIGEGAFRGELLRNRSVDLKDSIQKLNHARMEQSAIAEKIGSIERLQKQGEIQLQQHHNRERMRREECEVEELSVCAPMFDRVAVSTCIGTAPLHDIGVALAEVKMSPLLDSLETHLPTHSTPQLYSVTGEITVRDGGSVTFTLTEQTPRHLNIVVNAENLDVPCDSKSLEDELNNAGYTVARLQVEGNEPSVD